jgi:hypothetical protein
LSLKAAPTGSPYMHTSMLTLRQGKWDTAA